VVVDVGQIKPTNYTTPFDIRSSVVIKCLVRRSDVTTLAGPGGEEKYIRQVLLDGTRVAGAPVKDVSIKEI
jgi:hypothetical protein